ncbi:DUF262 domain-containing protein [Limosilactobacillus caviae]|uniref:DUF262 domain-containing protein n=2 Tax=Limosilactobacillus caviae TaxID=1769424 RepID=UPI001E5265DF|nr:DUF262 domain-containing protein [Limosilactobacillus caviae]
MISSLISPKMPKGNTFMRALSLKYLEKGMFIKMDERLESQYENSVQSIKTDQYSLSVGELINMYKDGDMIIDPEYQRYYRWKMEQRSSFIESMILGIPVPSIFVSQDGSGKWDVIDGLQRISTLLQLTGELKNEKPLVLKETKFLPALRDKTWETLGPNFQRRLKRRRINAIIIDSSNNTSIKYELFQRLNTNGTNLSPQEIRNVVIAMANHNLFRETKSLSQNESFKKIISNMTKRQRNEQLDKELIDECYILLTVPAQSMNPSDDLQEFITKKLIDNDKLLENLDSNGKKMLDVFELMARILGDKASKAYKNGKYGKRFMRPIFEMTFVYTAFHKQKIEYNNEVLEQYHKKISKSALYEEITKRGMRPVDRIKKILLFKGDLNVKKANKNSR